MGTVEVASREAFEALSLRVEAIEKRLAETEDKLEKETEARKRAMAAKQNPVLK